MEGFKILWMVDVQSYWPTETAVKLRFPSVSSDMPMSLILFELALSSPETTGMSYGKVRYFSLR